MSDRPESDQSTSSVLGDGSSASSSSAQVVIHERSRPTLEVLAWLAAIVAACVAVIVLVLSMGESDSTAGTPTSLPNSVPPRTEACTVSVQPWPDGYRFGGCDGVVEISGEMANAEPHYGPSAFELPEGVVLGIAAEDYPDEIATIEGPTDLICFAEHESIADLVTYIAAEREAGFEDSQMELDPIWLLTDDIRTIEIGPEATGNAVFYGSCGGPNGLTGADLSSTKVEIEILG